MSHFNIQLVTSETEFDALAGLWQSLAAQDDQATIFNDWQWNSLWWKHYKHLGQLFVLLVYAENQLVCIVPLYQSRSVSMKFFKQNTLRFIGTGGDTSPDDVNLIALPKYREAVVDTVWDYILGAKFERYMFTDLPLDSPFHETGLQRVQCEPGYASSPQINTRRCAQLPDDWAGFRQQISRNTYKQIKRRQNRLNKAGMVQFQHCETEDEVVQGFDHLVELHGARWSAIGEGGAFRTSAYLGFHREFMLALHASEQLWLLTLSVDNQVVGVEYAFLYNGTLQFFQTGFNPEFEHLSPGHLLMIHAIQKAIDAGVKRIDLLKGDYDYKTSYTNEEVHSASWTYYSKGVVGLLAKLRDKLL